MMTKDNSITLAELSLIMMWDKFMPFKYAYLIVRSILSLKIHFKSDKGLNKRSKEFDVNSRKLSLLDS